MKKLVLFSVLICSVLNIFGNNENAAAENFISDEDLEDDGILATG